MNYRVVSHTLGWVLNFEAICMFLSLICGLIYKEYEIVKWIFVCIMH